MRVLIGASVTVVSLLIGVSLAGASSPWLPEKGHTDLSVGVIYEEFDQFWRGGQRRAFPPGKFKQVSTVVSVEHGLFEDISLDLTVGYVRAYGDPRTNDGLMVLAIT